MVNITKKDIIFITLIVLTLIAVYVLKSSPSEEDYSSSEETFVSLNGLNTEHNAFSEDVQDAIEICDRLISEKGRFLCHRHIAWPLGYQGFECQKLGQEMKDLCEGGYGRAVGKEFGFDMTEINALCIENTEYTDIFI